MYEFYGWCEKPSILQSHIKPLFSKSVILDNSSAFELSAGLELVEHLSPQSFSQWLQRHQSLLVSLLGLFAVFALVDSPNFGLLPWSDVWIWSDGDQNSAIFKFGYEIIIRCYISSSNKIYSFQRLTPASATSLELPCYWWDLPRRLDLLFNTRPLLNMIMLNIILYIWLGFWKNPWKMKNMKFLKYILDKLSSSKVLRSLLDGTVGGSG